MAPLSWHGLRRLRLDMAAADEFGGLAPQISLDETDNAVRRDDDEADQEKADDQQIDRRRNGDGGDLLQRAEQDGADQRPDPARRAADQRHRDRIDGVVEPEGRGWLRV